MQSRLEQVDHEGEEIGLESLIAQMMELLVVLVYSPRFSLLMQSMLPDIYYHCAGFLQMTKEQVRFEVCAVLPEHDLTDESEFCELTGGKLVRRYRAIRCGGGRLAEFFQSFCR